MADLTLSNVGGVRAMSQCVSGKIVAQGADAGGYEFVDLGFVPSFVFYYHDVSSGRLGFASRAIGDTSNVLVIDGAGVAKMSMGARVVIVEDGTMSGFKHGPGIALAGVTAGDTVYFTAFR